MSGFGAARRSGGRYHRLWWGRPPAARGGRPPPPRSAAPPPRRPPAPPLAVADEIRLQPAGQAMLARRRAQPIGHQHQRTVRQGPTVARPPAALAIENRVEAQLPPQRPRHQHRAPIPRARRLHLARPPRGAPDRLPTQQTDERIKVRGEEILAAEIAHDALLGAAVLPVGFDEADILVLDALAAGRLHGAQEHRLLLSPHNRRNSARRSRNTYDESVTTLLAPTHPYSRQFGYLHVVPLPNKGNMG